MTHFERGSIVKLNDRFAKALASAKGKPTQWLGRKGMVVSCGDTAVSVLWEGRKSVEYVPLKAVEYA